MATAVDWSTFSLTGTGHILNQDRAGADGVLFCLADGMGGPAGGHIAATTAIRSIFGARPTDAASLQQAIRSANHAVRAAGQRRPGEAEMGTTLTAVLVTGSGLLVASVGDTRCHVSDGIGIRQLTEDDTVAATMEISPGDARYEKATSVLTCSLGSSVDLEIQVLDIPVSHASTVILTTDGVHEHVTLDDLRHDPRVHLDDQAMYVVSEALKAGSQDDASTLLIAVDP